MTTSNFKRAATAALALAWVGSTAAKDAVPSARIAQFSGDRAAAISYTFDDGLRDQFTLAVPILNEVGFKATFFVIPSKTAETPEEGEQRQNNPDVHQQWGGISWPELKEMSNQGHEIASHTMSHRNMAKIPFADVEAELGKAYETIKTRIGKPPLTLAFPYNQSTPEVQAAALKYHVAYRSFQLGTGGKSTAESLNTWADKLVRDKKWGIIMTHAVTHGYAEMSSPEVLRGHFKYVKAHEWDVWVDTFSNIARYDKEQNDAKLQVAGTAGNLTCTLGSTLDPALYDVPLTIVIDAAKATSAKAERTGKPLPTRVGNDLIYVDAAPSTQAITVTWK